MKHPATKGADIALRLEPLAASLKLHSLPVVLLRGSPFK
jgi:hypothetical protein